MEPVAEIIGHCFVVGARHQLRASMSGWHGRGLLEQGAQVGHGGVALALAREFEVYDMVVHNKTSLNVRHTTTREFELKANTFQFKIPGAGWRVPL